MDRRGVGGLVPCEVRRVSLLLAAELERIRTCICGIRSS